MSAPEPGACPHHPRHHPSPASIAPPRHHRCPATTHHHCWLRQRGGSAALFSTIHYLDVHVDLSALYTSALCAHCARRPAVPLAAVPLGSSRPLARTKSAAYLPAAYLRALPWVADDPQDAVVAKQYKSNKAEFEATAKYWTDIYAGELSPKP